MSEIEHVFRFDCHLDYNGDNPVLAHLQGEAGHERLRMQPFDALVVKLTARPNGINTAAIYLNGKKIAKSHRVHEGGVT